jgi:hypothetical protein
VTRFLRTVLSVALLVVGPAIGAAEDRPFLTTAPTPEGYAWWLRTEYHPFGTDVRGIPAARIHAGWCKVNELRKDLFPADLAKYFQDEQSPFAVDGFFDGSKTRHTALVGVYETCKGARGAFLLIVAWPEGKPPAIRHLVNLPGERQFAVVFISDDVTVTLQHCLECDHISQYRWDKVRRRFVLLPARDED